MKHLLKRSVNAASYCWKERKPCVRWVDKYFKDCLCNQRDDFSFAFGIVSLVAWGVAEVPQIITNFRTKSGHGVSLLFLLTWVLGDMFNLLGCLLEPATLPTQFYTALMIFHTKSIIFCAFTNFYASQVAYALQSTCFAQTVYTLQLTMKFGALDNVPSIYERFGGLLSARLFCSYTEQNDELYTVSTVVLVLQSIYYDHFNRWWKCPTRHSRIAKEAEEERKPLMAKAEELGIPIPSAPPRSPAQREFYYTSARSLAGSDTPPFRSYLRGASSGPSAVGLEESSSSDDERTSVSSSQPASGPNHIPRSAAQGAILAASVNLPTQTRALTQASLQLTGMRLVQKNQFEHHAFGQWLGWLMAAIYMGGRIPQIILNIKRGSVEGLNPLMFIFALIANITYVASILVRSTKWDKIKENMPWLLDAVVCVALDLFIILQYAYYKYTRKK